MSEMPLDSELSKLTEAEVIELAKKALQTKEYQKRYIEDHKEKIKDYQKKYREMNQEQVRALKRQYYYDNKEKILQKRADKLASMSEEDREAYLAKDKEYKKRYYAKKKEEAQS